MPQLKHATPKYRCHRPSGQAVVTLSGRVFNLGPWRSRASRTGYDRLVGEWLASDRRLPDRSQAAVYTVSELIRDFWNHAQQEYVKLGRPTGTADNFRPVLRMLRRRYGKRPARKVGPVALKALRQRVIEVGWSRTYINNNVDRLRQVFRWGVEDQRVPVRVHQALATVANLRKGRGVARETPPIFPAPNSIVEHPNFSPSTLPMTSTQRPSQRRTSGSGAFGDY